jgi:hypothetical protein
MCVQGARIATFLEDCCCVRVQALPVTVPVYRQRVMNMWLLLWFTVAQAVTVSQCTDCGTPSCASVTGCVTYACDGQCHHPPPSPCYGPVSANAFFICQVMDTTGDVEYYFYDDSGCASQVGTYPNVPEQCTPSGAISSFLDVLGVYYYTSGQQASGSNTLATCVSGTLCDSAFSWTVSVGEDRPFFVRVPPTLQATITIVPLSSSQQLVLRGQNSQAPTATRNAFAATSVMPSVTHCAVNKMSSDTFYFTVSLPASASAAATFNIRLDLAPAGSCPSMPVTTATSSTARTPIASTGVPVTTATSTAASTPVASTGVPTTATTVPTPPAAYSYSTPATVPCPFGSEGAFLTLDIYNHLTSQVALVAR